MSNQHIRLFMKTKKNQEHRSLKEIGFTLIEILVVVAILGILSSLLLVAVRSALERARFIKAKSELRSIEKALYLYMLDHNFNYPADVSRGMPSGLENYLASGQWPNPPWLNSYYDWDYWDSNSSNSDAGTLSYPPEGEVYQISVRFCEPDDSDACTFPKESWADNFDYYSSAYWCLSGSCRAHGGMPYDHPGCCIGGVCPSDQPRCE